MEYLLVRLKEELDKTGTKLLVVHIPRGNAEVAKIIAEVLKEKGILKGGS